MSSRAGFSLIELLIVVAIIAALVGVAAPFFQEYVGQAQRAKAAEDLQLIKQSIARYENQEGRILVGTDLKVLLGRYMQELPTDPWGNPYLFDGVAGFLGSYGADALPGGSGAEADIYANSISVEGAVYPVMPVMPRRAQYYGNWGLVRPPTGGDLSDLHTGNKLVITFTRPVEVMDFAVLPEDLAFIYPDETVGGGNSVQLSDATSWLPDTWLAATSPVFPSVDPLHRPDEGYVVVRAAQDNLTLPTSSRITPRTAFDLHDAELGSVIPSLSTSYVVDGDPPSPLDPSVYGPLALENLPLLAGPPNDESAVRGLRLERY